MRTQDKNRHSGLHISPINRNLLLVVILGLLAALSVSTVAALMASHL